ncbi:MAG: hypothetical protein AAF299_13755, partial [Pseudomonadota bacterium]
DQSRGCRAIGGRERFGSRARRTVVAQLAARYAWGTWWRSVVGAGFGVLVPRAVWAAGAQRRARVAAAARGAASGAGCACRVVEPCGAGTARSDRWTLAATLLVFIGEGVRDAFDPRKTFS